MPQTDPFKLPPGATLDKPRDPHMLPQGATLDDPDVEQNFFERYGDDLKRNFGEVGSEIIGRRMADDQGFMHTAWQLSSKVGAQSLVDFVTEAIVSGGRGLATIAGEDLTNDVKQSATKAGVFLLNTDLGKKGVEAALKGAYEWSEYKKKDPVMAASIEGLIPVGMLIAPVKVRAVKQTSLGRAAAKPFLKSGAKRKAAQTKDFVDGLVKPKETIKTLEDAVTRTTEIGRLSTKVTGLTDDQFRQAAAIRKIPGVSASKTLQGNYNVIAKASNKKARALELQLQNLGQKGKYSLDDLRLHLDNTTRVRMNDVTILKGDAAAITDRTIEAALAHASQRPHYLRGLLTARRSFDKATKKEFPKIFDQAATAQDIVYQDARREMNRFIAARVPRARGPFGKPLIRVKESLESQSLLNGALKTIKKKAAKEGRNKVAMAIQTLLKVIPIRNELIAALSVMYGIGGLGSASLFAPLIQKLALGYGIVAGTRGMIMAPGTRTGIGKMILMLDRRIRITNDINKLRELRAVRVGLVDLVKDSEVTKEAEEYKEAQ